MSNLRKMDLFGYYKKEDKTNSLSNSIDAAGDAAYYDSCCKRLISHKIIFAWIMKSCLKEYRDFDLEIIKGCINNDLSISKKPVHQNEIVINENSEDSSITDGVVRYDIRFTVVVPNCDNKVNLIINVEGQNDSYPGYSLVKRGIYYCIRLISSQYGNTFTDSNYNDIVKVYSIWICTGNFERVNPAITHYSIMKENICGNIHVPEKDYDLMTLIIIYLCKDTESTDVDIIRLLTYLLSPNIHIDKKKKVLTEEFDIGMTICEEVSNMSSLGETLLEKGIEEITALYKELREAGKIDEMCRAVDNIEYRKELLKQRQESKSLK